MILLYRRTESNCGPKQQSWIKGLHFDVDSFSKKCKLKYNISIDAPSLALTPFYNVLPEVCNQGEVILNKLQEYSLEQKATK